MYNIFRVTDLLSSRFFFFSRNLRRNDFKFWQHLRSEWNCKNLVFFLQKKGFYILKICWVLFWLQLEWRTWHYFDINIPDGKLNGKFVTMHSEPRQQLFFRCIYLSVCHVSSMWNQWWTSKMLINALDDCVPQIGIRWWIEVTSVCTHRETQIEACVRTMRASEERSERTIDGQSERESSPVWTRGREAPRSMNHTFPAPKQWSFVQRERNPKLDNECWRSRICARRIWKITKIFTDDYIWAIFISKKSKRKNLPGAKNGTKQGAGKSLSCQVFRLLHAVIGAWSEHVRRSGSGREASRIIRERLRHSNVVGRCSQASLFVSFLRGKKFNSFFCQHE